MKLKKISMGWFVLFFVVIGFIGWYVWSMPHHYIDKYGSDEKLLELLLEQDTSSGEQDVFEVEVVLTELSKESLDVAVAVKNPKQKMKDVLIFAFPSTLDNQWKFETMNLYSSNLGVYDSDEPKAMYTLSPEEESKVKSLEVGRTLKLRDVYTMDEAIADLTGMNVFVSYQDVKGDYQEDYLLIEANDFVIERVEE